MLTPFINIELTCFELIPAFVAYFNISVAIFSKFWRRLEDNIFKRKFVILACLNQGQTPKAKQIFWFLVISKQTLLTTAMKRCLKHPIKLWQEAKSHSQIDNFSKNFKISTWVNQGQTSRLGKKFWIVAVSNRNGIIL